MNSLFQIVASCSGVTTEDGGSGGVDRGVSVAMHFAGGRVATFVTDLRVDLPCTADIAGTQGLIQVLLKDDRIFDPLL